MPSKSDLTFVSSRAVESNMLCFELEHPYRRQIARRVESCGFLPLPPFESSHGPDLRIQMKFKLPVKVMNRNNLAQSFP